MNDGFLIENAVRNELDRQGLTQTDIAREVKYCQSTIHDWIIGRHRISKKTAEQIAIMLGVQIEKIFDDSNEPRYISGKKLYELRNPKNITLQKIADKLFISRGVVARWACYGKYRTKCRKEYITKIAELLEVQPEDLIEEGE